MKIKVCKWKNNAKSPVMFMVDDLANVWVDLSGNGKIDRGEDWGYAKYEENSSITFLEEEILNQFPDVKVNFYVPVGKRIGMVRDSDIYMYSNPINENKSTIEFFRSLNNDSRYELSYHGLTHGEVYNKPEDQKQEWECYSSLNEALETIDAGKAIFREVTGEYPKGGKYCGYTKGKYGDESIDKSNFLWWNRNLNYINVKKYCGDDDNKITNFDIKIFGENNVIDIPSTLGGDIFNTKSSSRIKTVVKRILKFYMEIKGKKEIDFLLKNNLVISIQEHISPARDDGKVQTPNIFDDKESLIKIFKYLKDKNVWYCTGTELAKYVSVRDKIKIVKKNNNSFAFSEIDFNDRKNHEISVKIDLKCDKIMQPNKVIVSSVNNIFNLEIMEGNYKILGD
ncbi:hypothetical protein PM10SUCC1_24360 [Propionigenium maris DSM 9537]|uniref:DUF2334 domain-containing protein n=1 Tax=Propionigenium maris DSM 9537 TaxID=1123000 RepID=A0A9W6GNQ9_9FUSO|nr:hypothetical protein [Propionigenium maris]GLI56922.1 hypothetical protein PM10SUCC1_24360 [Propionigenium maris DSM 9537]